MFYIYLILFLVSIFLSVFWVRGIENMKEKHPDYKGEDLMEDD